MGLLALHVEANTNIYRHNGDDALRIDVYKRSSF